MTKEFKNKRIWVTGGTGSIGSVIVKELLKLELYQIRIFSRDETKQFELMHDAPLAGLSRIHMCLSFHQLFLNCRKTILLIPFLN